MATFLYVINKPIIYKFLKHFTKHRKKTNRAVVLAADLSQTFLNTEIKSKTIQESWKQDSFRHIEDFS